MGRLNRAIGLAPLMTMITLGVGSGVAVANSHTESGPITEAAATAIADATATTWTSMDPARIKALYAPDIVGFDMMTPALSSDRATWDTLQDGFVAAKIDHAVQRDRKIQLLDADTFIMSGVWDLTSTAIPANAMTIRCSDVYQKAGGNWLIVNEHCSQSPKP